MSAETAGYALLAIAGWVLLSVVVGLLVGGVMGRVNKGERHEDGS